MLKNFFSKKLQNTSKRGPTRSTGVQALRDSGGGRRSMAADPPSIDGSKRMLGFMQAPPHHPSINKSS